MGLFGSTVGWDRPGEPLALSAIRLFGALKAKLTGREQYVAGDTTSHSSNNWDKPEACRVIANPRMRSDDYSLWVEKRVHVDGPGDYVDEVSFEHLGSFNGRETRAIVEQYRAKETASDIFA